MRARVRASMGVRMCMCAHVSRAGGARSMPNLPILLLCTWRNIPREWAV